MPGLLGVEERRRLVTITVYMTEEQRAALDRLAARRPGGQAARRGCSVAQLVREGIDLALARHRDGPGWPAP